MERTVTWLTVLSLIYSLGLPSVGAQVREKRLTRSDVVKDPDAIQKHTSIALLVGIGDYDKGLTGLPSLKYPVTDIASIGAVLKQQGYDVALLTDHSATAGAIRESFRELTKALDPGEGTFLFYFSGHGFRTGNENYLATFGTTVSDLANQGLAVSEVEKLLSATGAKRRIALLDACRNDPDTKSVGSGARSFGDLQDAQGLRMFLSTAPGDVSYEDDSLQHGVFSYFVLQGLSGKAANNADGFITFDDLRDYVTREMKSYGIARRKIQKPYQMGESTGDFLVGKRLSAAASAAADPPPPVKPTPTPVVAPTTEVASKAPPVAAPSVQQQSITAINSGATSLDVNFLWQSDAHPGMLFRLKLDSDAIYLYAAQGNLIGTLLKKQKQDKKGTREIYEGTVPLAPATGCPGGRGTMQVNSWNANRIDALIEAPIRNTQNGQITCNASSGIGSDKVSRFLSKLMGVSWQPVTFVKR